MKTCPYCKTERPLSEFKPGWHKCDVCHRSDAMAKLQAKQKLPLTHSAVKTDLNYDLETGQFSWRPGHQRAGQVAGAIRRDGYIVIRVRGHLVLAHRLVHFWMTGNWPVGEMDHINHVRNDNRWCNLRDVSPRQNCANLITNTSGHVGITQEKCFGKPKWRAIITVSHKKIHLGYFDEFDDAVAARQLAEISHSRPFFD